MKEETKQMGLMKKLTSAIVASSLVFSLASAAFAAYTPAAGEEAGARMQKLGIIQGRPDGLALNSEITRAELVTVIVRAFGKEDDAKLLKGSTIFPDIQNHWASGNIAMAVALVEKAGSDPIGMPNGKFEPDTKLTPAQAVAFLMKFLGQKADAGKTWPSNYLDVAVEKGLITADDKALIAPMLNENATRGLVFYMFDRAFVSYKLPTGGTFYTTYVDTKAPELTVDAVAETTIDSKVTITGSVKDYTELYVGTTKVTPAADGKFSAEFALPEIKAEPYTITVTAIDLAGNKAEKPLKVTRIVGDAKAVSAPASIEVVAGATADVAVKVLDEKNQEIAGAAVTGTSDLGTFENGKFVAGEKAGTGTLTLTAGALTKEVAVTVKAGALAKLAVTPATVDLSAGASQKFAVAGTDAFGNEVAAPTNVNWTASKGIMGPDGTFGATNDATGTVTVTATAGAVSGTASVNVFGKAVKLVAAAPASLVANGKSVTQLTLQAVDANGNVDRTFNGSVSFVNSNNSIAALSSTSATAVNGLATIDLTAGTAVGSAVVSISSTGLTGATATVTTVAQTATSVTVTADPATLAADNVSIVTLTATMMDQTGNPMKAAPTGSWTIDFTSSDTTIVAAGTTTVSENFAMSNGKFVAVSNNDFYAKNNLGSATISAVVKKDTIASTTVSANASTVSTALVGVPYKLAIDTIADAKAAGTTTETTQTVAVRVLDVNGNQVTGIGTAVTAVLSDASSTSTISGPTWANGKATFTVVNTTAETVAYTATATWNATPAVTLVKAEASGKFVPGAASVVGLAVSPDTVAANGTSTATLKATITDAAGNAVTDGTYAVKFKRTNSAPYAVANWTETTVNTVNGEASVTVTATNSIAQDRFTAEVIFSGTTATVSAARTLDTKIIGVPNQLKFGTITGVDAGKEISVPVQVHDATSGTSNLVSYDNSTVVTLEVTDPDSVKTTYTGVAANGVATIKATFTKKGSYTAVATASGLKGAGTTGGNTGGTFAIAPAVASAIKVTPNVTALSADGTSKATLTIQMVDAYGNVTSNGDLVGMTLTNGTTAVGALGTAVYFEDTEASDALEGGEADSVKDSATVVFTTSTTPGTSTITAKKTNLTDGTVALSTQVVGQPAKMAVEVGAEKKVTVGTKELQKVTVTVQDASGNRVTNTTKYVKLSTTSGGGTVNIYTNSAGTTALVPGALTALTLDNAGQVSFYVTATTAGSVAYKAELYDAADGTVDGNKTANMTAGTATGSFIANVAAAVNVVAGPDGMAGNGSNISVVTATITDANGNTVSSATGNIKFRIPAVSGFTHAYIQGAGSDGWYTAPVSNGQAVAVVMARQVTSTATVSVEADYWAADATAVTVDHTAQPVITIGLSDDTTAPTLTTVVTAATPGALANNDTIVVTFSEATQQPVLTASSFTLASGKTFGTGATFAWTSSTVLTITVKTGVNLVDGDVIAFASAGTVKDLAGLNAGTTIVTLDTTP